MQLKIFGLKFLPKRNQLLESVVDERPYGDDHESEDSEEDSFDLSDLFGGFEQEAPIESVTIETGWQRARVLSFIPSPPTFQYSLRVVDENGVPKQGINGQPLHRVFEDSLNLDLVTGNHIYIWVSDDNDIHFLPPDILEQISSQDKVL